MFVYEYVDTQVNFIQFSIEKFLTFLGHSTR